MKIIKHFILIVSLFILSSCEDESTSPRPFGYFRINLEEAIYQKSKFDCPYGFEYSEQAQLIMKDRGRCWINIYYPKHKATIYITYIHLNGDLSEQLEQTQQLTYEHQIKATKIDRIPIHNDSNNVHGLRYDLSGDVASNIQFYVTDSIKHFVRAALYFEAYVNEDSLKPVLEYMNKDIQHMLSTFHWN